MADDTPYIKETPTGFYLSVRVLPGAKHSCIVGVWNNQFLKVSLKAPAVDGKANEALVDYLSDMLKVKKKSIFWMTGQTSRCKLLFIEISEAAEKEKRIRWLKHILSTEK